MSEPTPEQVKALVKMVILDIQFADLGHYTEQNGERVYQTTPQQIDNLSEVAIELTRKIIAAGWHIDATPSPAGQQGEAMDHEGVELFAISCAEGDIDPIDEPVRQLALAYLALRASTQPTPPPEREVPREPTQEMVEAAIAAFGEDDDVSLVLKITTALQRALDAAPPPAPAAMAEALDGLLLVCGRTGNSLDDFEEQAEAFHRETGWMRPGKDMAAAAGGEDDHEKRRAKYREWVDGKINAARALAHPSAMAEARGEVTEADLRALYRDKMSPKEYAQHLLVNFHITRRASGAQGEG